MKQGTWDIVRGAGPFVDDRRGIEFGSGFNNHNVEKLGITLNLREERGKQLLRALVAESDVVTENFAAGVMARMGFSYDELRAIKPDIVYVSNSGFGAWGPNTSFKTWGPIVQAVERAHVQLGAARPATGGLGLLLHGPHGRRHHGGGDPGRADPPQPHR